MSSPTGREPMKYCTGSCSGGPLEHMNTRTAVITAAAEISHASGRLLSTKGSSNGHSQ
jgi:hypothetical protein